MRMTIWLDPDDAQRLRARAERERRDPRDEAALIIARSVRQTRLDHSTAQRELVAAGA